MLVSVSNPSEHSTFERNINLCVNIHKNSKKIVGQTLKFCETHVLNTKWDSTRCTRLFYLGLFEATLPYDLAYVYIKRIIFP